MKGVISFVVASVFLLVLVSSAAKLSEREPDYSWQPLVAAHLQQEAIEAAFSSALSDAAGKSMAVSMAAGADSPVLVKTALYLSALDFEAQLREEGYDTAFWCGQPSEAALQAASERMAAGRHAAAPEGALPLSNPACADGFGVNLLKKKARVSDVGFSLYSKNAGIGFAAQFPDGYEVDFDG